MELAEITRLIEEGKVEYVKIGAADIEGVYRGKRVAARHFLNSLEDGFAQCDVLFGWDIGEVVLPNLKFSNWERGFADIVMKPDLCHLCRRAMGRPRGQCHLRPVERAWRAGHDRAALRLAARRRTGTRHGL